jgi:hypothetical protein
MTKSFNRDLDAIEQEVLLSNLFGWNVATQFSYSSLVNSIHTFTI